MFRFPLAADYFGGGVLVKDAAGALVCVAASAEIATWIVATLNGARIPIGVSDRHGRPIHVGDRLRFDPAEWGGPCEFTIEIRDGQIVHPGATGDLSAWCEIVEQGGNNA